MAVRVGQHGIGVVFLAPLFGRGHVVVVQHPLERDVRDVVELRHDGVEQLGTRKAVLSLDLRCEMAEDDDGGCVGSNEDGADEELEMLKPIGVTIDQSFFLS